MKMMIFFSLLVLTGMACKKDNGDDTNPAGAYIKLTVDGKSWSSDGMVVIGTSFVDGKHNFTMSGRDENFEGAVSSMAAVFSSTGEIGVGTYTLTGADPGATLTQINGKTYLGAGVAATTFVIQITEVRGTGAARKFKGTFHGSLKGPAAGDIITVTNGDFSSL